MNIHDVHAKIDDLRSKLAGATGDDKTKYQAEIDKLEEELKSAGQNMGDDIKNIMKH